MPHTQNDLKQVKSNTVLSLRLTAKSTDIKQVLSAILRVKYQGEIKGSVGR